MLLLLQNFSRNLPNLSWIIFSVVHTNLRLGFLKTEILIYFFSFLLICDPMGVKISKCYFYKLQPNVLKLALNFPPSGPKKNYTFELELDFWNLEFPIFNALVFRKFQLHHCILWRNQKPQLSGKRAIVERKWVKFSSCIWGTFGLEAFKVIFGSFGALSIFHN